MCSMMLSWFSRQKKTIMVEIVYENSLLYICILWTRIIAPPHGGAAPCRLIFCHPSNLWKLCNKSKGILSPGEVCVWWERERRRERDIMCLTQFCILLLLIHWWILIATWLSNIQSLNHYWSDKYGDFNKSSLPIVLILNANSDHVSHVWRKIGLLGCKNSKCDFSRSNQIPLTDQTTEAAPYVCTYFWVTI